MALESDKMNRQYVNVAADEIEVAEYAIQVKNVTKSYGKTKILSGINLGIKKGGIYGLLGSSGCGKTTLLRLLTGRLQPDSGSIKCFGCPVGSEESGIPGDRVGYMPQEVALFSEFTIKETLIYFGHIFNMSASDVRERTQFLLKLLQLSNESALVRYLSGGQKRRVSFAVSLIQSAPLLILDEPTVGVDPLLRQSIWNYLQTLVQESTTTVILTTHYIDEVQQANMVGLMRDGRILAEDSPENLLIKYKSTNLEDVFLKLCNMAEMHHSPAIAYKNEDMIEDIEIIKENDTTYKTANIRTKYRAECKVNGSKKSSSNRFFISTNRTRAVVLKNYALMRRNIGALFLQFILPAMQLTIFCVCLGHEPVNLDIGTVNDDTSHLQFGQLFFESLDNHSIRLQKYDDFNVSLEAINDNKIWGLIYVPSNFSANLLTRFSDRTNVTNEVLQGGKIKIWLDQVDQEILYTLRMKVLSSVQKFLFSVLQKNGINPHVADLPVSFETQDFEYDEQSVIAYMIFMAPGVIIVITYFVTLALTNMAFLMERKDGLLERIYVAGVTDVELVLGFCISQGLVMSVQIALSVSFMIGLLNVPCEGSIFTVLTILLLQGWNGIFHGLFVSAITDNEYLALFVNLLYLFQCLDLTGIIWPIQGMPKIFQFMCYSIPQTYPIQSLRAVLLRGWGITEMVVWRGILLSSFWLTVFVIATVVAVRYLR